MGRDDTNFQVIDFAAQLGAPAAKPGDKSAPAKKEKPKKDPKNKEEKK